jgi:hypothetical protein
MTPSRLNTIPFFITKRTSRSAPMSSIGFPGTAMRHAAALSVQRGSSSLTSAIRSVEPIGMADRPTRHRLAEIAACRNVEPIVDAGVHSRQPRFLH